MKCKKAGIYSLLFLSLLFTGCSKPQLPNSEVSTSVVDDPMKMPVESESNVTGSSGFKAIGSYGFDFSQDDISFSDDTLVLTPKLLGDEIATDVGIMVLVDGIPQIYSTETPGEKFTLKEFKTENGEVPIKLLVDAMIDSQADNHYVSILTIVAPYYMPSADSVYFGKYHSGSIVGAKNLPDKDTYTSSDSLKVLKAENSVFTKEQKENYQLSEDQEIIYFDLYRDKSKPMLERAIVGGIEDNTLSLTFTGFSCGHEGGNYRVTFYRNHEPCLFNDGFRCLDMELEGGKIVEADIELAGVKPGDFVYCVAAPLFEGGNALKSQSKMVILSENDVYGGGEASSLPFEENSPESEFTNADNTVSTDEAAITSSVSEPSNVVSTSSSNEIEGNTSISEPSDYTVSNNLIPQFSIGDRIYYLDNRESIALCASKDGISIDKTLEIGNLKRISYHGEYISVLEKSGSDYSVLLLDKELNTVKTQSINGILDEMSRLTSVSVDFDGDNIIYVYHTIDGKSELRCCDWNLENQKVLLELPNSGSEGASYFKGIAITKNFVALTLGGKINNVDTDYYGIADFSGKSEIHRKDGITEPQTNGKIALWTDKHVNTGEYPSGELVLYDGRFQTMNTSDRTESQRCFLQSDGAFLTIIETGKSVLRQYNQNKLIGETIVGSNIICGNMVEFDGKVFAYITESGSSKCVVWEMN